MRLAARRLSSAAAPAPRHVPGEFRIGEAFLRYEPLNDDGSVIDIRTTAVPPALRGQGIAEQLCEAAFEHARDSRLKVVPSCTFVRDRFVPDQVDRFADLTLASFDASTPGLQISVSALGVATLQLANPRRRNPLTAPLLTRMRDFLQHCAAMEVQHTGPLPPVRTILIEALGPVFSSGHDFSDFAGKSAVEQRAVLDVCSEVNMLLQQAPQVSVAAVAGHCLAGGAQLASSCDLVLARSDASFCLPGVRSGGFCHTPAVAVAARVPPRKALELALLAADVNAEEAERIGLVNTCSEERDLNRRHRGQGRSGAVVRQGRGTRGLRARRGGAARGRQLRITAAGSLGARLKLACPARVPRAVETEDWPRRVDEICAQLARSFNRSVADGKRTFYQQVAAPSLDAKYEIATGTMVDMFGSPAYQASMEAFLSRKKLKPKPDATPE